MHLRAPRHGLGLRVPRLEGIAAICAQMATIPSTRRGFEALDSFAFTSQMSQIPGVAGLKTSLHGLPCVPALRQSGGDLCQPQQLNADAPTATSKLCTRPCRALHDSMDPQSQMLQMRNELSKKSQQELWIRRLDGLNGRT